MATTGKVHELLVIILHHTSFMYVIYHHHHHWPSFAIINEASSVIVVMNPSYNHWSSSLYKRTIDKTRHFSSNPTRMSNANVFHFCRWGDDVGKRPSGRSRSRRGKDVQVVHRPSFSSSPSTSSVIIILTTTTIIILTIDSLLLSSSSSLYDVNFKTGAAHFNTS